MAAVRSCNFCLLEKILYHKGSDGIWWRCVWHDEKDAVLREAHCGIPGGHYADEATAHKVWQGGLWWPTTQKDAQAYYRECDLCQRMGQPMEQAQMPHQLVLPLEAFQKWGLDFVGPFTLVMPHTGYKYILVAIDYYTKWVKTKALRDNTAASTTKFFVSTHLVKIRLPHQSVLPLKPFKKWALISSDHLLQSWHIRVLNKYILVATDYYTKWVEAKPL